MAIGDEPEDPALGVDGGFIVKRSVFEVKRQMSCHTIAAYDFDEIAIGKDLPLFRGQG